MSFCFSRRTLASQWQKRCQDKVLALHGIVPNCFFGANSGEGPSQLYTSFFYHLLLDFPVITMKAYQIYLTKF
jgi:hypothetical protein